MLCIDDIHAFWRDLTTDGTVVCHTGVIVNNETFYELDEKPARARANNLKTRTQLKVNGANPSSSATKPLSPFGGRFFYFWINFQKFFVQ